MAVNLLTLREVADHPLDTALSVAVKVVEIGDWQIYKNKEQQDRRYRVIRVADETDALFIRSYNVKLLSTLEAGRTYMFQNLVKKTGEHCLWAVSSTTSCQWVNISVPDDILKQTPVTKDQTTSLAQAIISPVTSKITAKIVQTSPLKYVKSGELPIKFLRLMDEQEGPRVKVALFGDDAVKDYALGDVITLTDTYRYKNSNNLSTKKSSTIEFLSPDVINIETSHLTFPDDEDFKIEPSSSSEPQEFTIMGVASATVYQCCSNPSCRNKKLESNGTCPTCQKASLTDMKHYAAATIYMEKKDGIVQHRVFIDQLEKMFDIPILKSLVNKDFTDILTQQLPVNGRGFFRNGGFVVCNVKRKDSS